MQNQGEHLLREQLLQVSQQLASLGLNRGTSAMPVYVLTMNWDNQVFW